jgi:hypothetical protein
VKETGTMEHYKIEIFGTIDDTDLFDEILHELRYESEPEDRARSFETFLKQCEGAPYFRLHSKMGSPFDNLKTHLKAGNLGWIESAADENDNYYQATVVSPGDYEEITVDLLHGEPVIELSVLLRVQEEGPEALEKLIATVEKSSKYGEDLQLILEGDLVERYIAECEEDAPAP